MSDTKAYININIILFLSGLSVWSYDIIQLIKLTI